MLNALSASGVQGLLTGQCFNKVLLIDNKIPKSRSVQESYTTFSSTLVTALNFSCPLNIPNRNHKIYNQGLKWWNSSCQALWNEKKLSYFNFLESPTVNNYIHYKHMIAKMKRKVKKEKRKAWHSFCSLLHPKTPISSIWKILRSVRTNKQPPHHNLNASWQDEFIRKFSANCFEENIQTPDLSFTWSTKSRAGEVLYQPISVRELTQLIQTKKKSLSRSGWHSS